MAWIRGLVVSAVLAASAQNVAAEPAMWTLSDDDTVIHLFGTIHVLPEKLDWRTPELDAAFDAADTFCVETDVIAKGMEMLQLTLKEGVFAGKERLSDYLTDEQARELHELSAAVGIVPASIEVQKPWQALMTLSSALAITIGLDEESGVEFVLLPIARASGKTICEMESPEAHIHSISKLPMDVQVAVLTYEEEDFDTVAEVLADARLEISELIEDWTNGDVEAIGEDGPNDYGHPDFYEAILVNRNRNWIPRIEELLAEPGTKFIAVGAAHLAGPDSVITMLRDKGYEVEGP